MRLRRPRSTGFVLPSAIFLLVVLAALAAFLVNISMTQHATSTQDVQGARAYQAARAGVEWGLYRVLNPDAGTLPACAAGNMTIEGFNVNVQCTSSDYTEAGPNRQIRVYQLVATASAGVFATQSYVEREVAVTVSKCRETDGSGQGYECP